MYVIWLTGISGSGKTTLGKALLNRLRDIGIKSDLIDGDDVRAFFDNDLGYSREDRIENNKRIIFAAGLLERNGIAVIVANIAPYAGIREYAKKNLKNYTQIYVKASRESCVKRDVKGHYKKISEGKMENFIGADQEYDIPEDPDLVVDTDSRNVEESLNAILNHLRENKLI